MKKHYILITLLLVFLVPANIMLAQELVINGDLELWDDPDNPSDWNKAENIHQAASPVHTGSYSAQHTSSPDGTKDLQQNVSGIVGGANYTISYYYFDFSTEAKTRIWAYWLDGTTTLDDHQAELRPGAYSENNMDWQHFSINLTAPANADGFRFEVRVYHEENNTGGFVYYDDFSVMGAGASPEPTSYPTDFAATVSEITINLSWTDAIGDQLPNGYLIKAATGPKIPAPMDGMPVEDDLDLSDGGGALNVAYGEEICSFGNLDGNTEYFFVIFPYTNGGADIDYKNDEIPPQVSATTADINVVLFQNFDDGFGTWQIINVSGTQEWAIDPQYGVGGTPCAKMNGYEGGSNHANEDWLISPVMDLDEFALVTLNFMTAMNYSGPELEVLVSDDYDGGGDPSTATWVTAGGTLSTGGFSWTESGNVDLSPYIGAGVYIAFKYSSTDAESSTWEVDNVSVTAGGLMSEPSNYPEDFVAVGLGSSIQLGWTDALGNQLPAGYIVLGSSEDNIIPPVDGTPIDDDSDLSDGTGALNISFGTETCAFASLGTNETYYFAIYPYNNAGINIDYKNDGTAPSASATTADVEVIEEQNFDDGWGLWNQVSVTGAQTWEIDDQHGINDSPCAKCTGYAGQPYANEDWLISPPLDFDNYSSEVLSFYTADAYDGPVLEAFISNDYNGSNLETATWTPLAFETSPGYFEWISSGNIDVSGIDGDHVFIAFKFTSTDQESATWEIDDIMITGVEEIGIGEGNNFTAAVNVYPNPVVNTVNVTTAAEGIFSVQLYSLLGEQVTQELSFTGKIVLDLGELRNGIYLIHITDEAGNTGMEKLMVRK